MPSVRPLWHTRAMPTFKATLFRDPGTGGWVFATVPKDCAPPVTEGWGRTPVTATLGDTTWETSVWWDTKLQQTLLPLKKAVRGRLDEGDEVELSIEWRER